MNMKLFCAAVAAGFAMASSASAAVTLLYEPAGNLTYKLHNTADDTAPTVRLDVVGEPFLVDLTGDTSLNQGGNNGQGFAQVDGTPNFDTLLIDPFNFAGFQAFQFNLDAQKKVLIGGDEVNVVPHLGTFRIDYTLIGGGGGFLIADLAFAANGKYRLVSDGAGMDTISLSGLNGFYKLKGNDTATALDFESIKQLSFEIAKGRGTGSGIPEPATWALMIVGFGGAGAMLRRRRSALA